MPADVDPTRDVAEDEAFAWELVGDKDAAFRELKVYINANPGQGGGLEAKGWRFRSLRDDPRFQALQKTNFPTETK